jgi:hypothetical protein
LGSALRRTKPSPAPAAALVRALPRGGAARGARARWSGGGAARAAPRGGGTRGRQGAMTDALPTLLASRCPPARAHGCCIATNRAGLGPLPALRPQFALQ